MSIFKENIKKKNTISFYSKNTINPSGLKIGYYRFQVKILAGWKHIRVMLTCCKHMNSVWINPALQWTVCTGVPSSFWFDPVVHFSFLFYTSNSCIATSSSIFFFFFFYLCNGAISLPPFHHYLQPSSVDFVPWKLSCCSAAFHSFVPYSHDTGFSVIIKHTFFSNVSNVKRITKKVHWTQISILYGCLVDWRHEH